MGRLTLNVLLSFGDKIAASKRKGLWMGGTLPLGYDAPKDPLKARVLKINPPKTATHRRLFALCLTAGSLDATRIAAAAQGLIPRKPGALNPELMRVQQAFRRRRRGAETR
jgi:site-specific DNA recombinase